MPLRLSNPMVGPPGSFRLTDAALALIDPSLATVGPFHCEAECLAELNKRRVGNKLPPMTVAEFEDKLCAHLPPGWCIDELGQPTRDPGSMALGLREVVQGTRTVGTWFLKGRQRVSKDEVVRRSYICNSCPMHVPIHGCQGCSGHLLREAVALIVGGESLPTDAMLQGCSVCKCGLKGKVRIPADVIVKNMPAEQRARLWDKCWLREGQP